MLKHKNTYEIISPKDVGLHRMALSLENLGIHLYTSQISTFLAYILAHTFSFQLVILCLSIIIQHHTLGEIFFPLNCYTQNNEVIGRLALRFFGLQILLSASPPFSLSLLIFCWTWLGSHNNSQLIYCPTQKVKFQN